MIDVYTAQCEQTKTMIYTTDLETINDFKDVVHTIISNEKLQELNDSDDNKKELKKLHNDGMLVNGFNSVELFTYLVKGENQNKDKELERLNNLYAILVNIEETEKTDRTAEKQAIMYNIDLLIKNK